MACGGRPVEMNLTREESIAYTRTRHAIDYDLAVGVNKDGSITAIDCNVYSNQGGYASHGHAIGGKGGTFINALYKTESLRYAAKTIYTNVATAGAMRGYGIPQVMFALESIMDDAAEKIGMDFDSRGEYEYYMGTILPKVQTGKIVKVELHRTFLLLPEKEYDAVKLPAVHYTPDFVLTYADGTVEAVEVKSKFVRRQQRDYIHRRRMFIDLVAEPRGWHFIEHITADTAAEVKAWKSLAKQKG